jgi:hypothetical protein
VDVRKRAEEQMILTWLTIGLFIGAFIGVCVMSLCVMAGRRSQVEALETYAGEQAHVKAA